MEKPFANRRIIVIGIFLFTGLIFIVRLFYIQIVADKYILSANNNVLRYMTQYPARGLVYDRNGKLLVFNEAAYDMMVIPRQVKAMDTIEFCRLLGIEVPSFRERLTKARAHSMDRPSVFENQISREQFAFLREKMFLFPGFFVQPRTLRKYPYPVAAHTLGYIGEVSPSTISRDPYYKSGDYIGISGIEKSYESVLRGKKGLHVRVVDVLNRDMGSFHNGKYDTAAIAGTDLWCTIDAGLQAYGEFLMQNKKGSIVAIEPATGEILCMVSSPCYDPNLLVGRIRNENYTILADDSVNIPLFNRTMMAQYPPGSTFKLANALAGEQEGVITPDSYHHCSGGYALGNGHVIHCHSHASPVNLVSSIQNSCNTYYCWLFKSMLDKDGFSRTETAYNRWRGHMLSFGLGEKTGLDLPNELTGFIPPTSYYDKFYGKNRWRSLTVISLAIGQGEVLLTPVQLANVTASIANRGYYIIPHVIKGVKKNNQIDAKYREKHFTTVSPRYYEPVIEGMELVVKNGTGTIAALDSISICAKTGTAQNPHGDNHSIFVAFAPRDNPQIAISVIIENAGYGATWAAPIASLMIEKYLKGAISRKEMEDRMVSKNLINP